MKLEKGNNKYYTPSIEEFYVGFECEIMSSYGWQQGVFPKVLHLDSLNNFGGDIFELTKLSDIRVKYLTKEDIEGLGWEFSSMMGNKDSASINWIKNSTQEQNAIWLVFRPIIQIIDCREKEHRVLFLGKIKNKSELIKLMKQLRIWE